MRLILILIVGVLLFTLSTFAQPRILTGKIINENLDVISQIEIRNADTLLLAMTDNDGKFKVDLPVHTKALLMSGIGYEWASINLNSGCEHADLILLTHSSYDFISLSKINRLRLKRFKKLSDLHLIAYKKGIFTTGKSCYKQTFIPIK